MDACALGGAVGLACWMLGLIAGMGGVTAGQGATAICTAAALTALTARVVLREPVPSLVWPFALLAVAALAMTTPEVWPLVLAGAGWGVHAFLTRRGDAWDRIAHQALLVAPVALILLVPHPPLRGELLVLALLAAGCLALASLTWHRLRIPALAPLALLIVAFGWIWGVAPGPELALALIGAFGIQRMIGSSGS